MVMDTLPSGLAVRLFQKPAFINSCAILAVRCGAFDQWEKDAAGQILTHPPGCAHFLEHKLFENSQGDAMADFSRLGASVNAWTGEEETAYYFTTTAEDIYKPLRLLLGFVRRFEIPAASVEKEKEIIQQERISFLEDPDSRLQLETMRSLFTVHPVRQDITGTRTSIAFMRRQDLWSLYKSKYVPENMVLILVSPKAPAEVLAQLRQMDAEIPALTGKRGTRILPREPAKPCRSAYTLSLPLTAARMMTACRLDPPSTLSRRELKKREWALRIALEAHFSLLNPAYQTWLDSGRITPFFHTEAVYQKDLGFLSFADETWDPSFTSWVWKEMENLQKTPLEKEDLTLLKKRLQGSFLSSFDDPETLALNVLDAWGSSLLMAEEWQAVEEINTAYIQKVLQGLDLSCRTVTTFVPESEK